MSWRNRSVFIFDTFRIIDNQNKNMCMRIAGDHSGGVEFLRGGGGAGAEACVGLEVWGFSVVGVL